MKAEMLKNYVGQRVKVSFWNTWEELVNNGSSSEWVETAGIQTLEGKVYFLQNETMLVQDDGVINQFKPNENITIEVLPNF
ncbi:hypothetical protein [Bacillus phage vB_BanS-Thrax5]|nr:hypothetical protein [Bacillus phage vB_BanS-Thrax5]